jgi:hypothetical protein
MTTRSLLFLAGIVAVPVLFWSGSVEGSLERRAGAADRLRGVDAILVQNQRALDERDQLQESWEAFKPLIDDKLDNLDYTLNPLLVQSHVLDIAERSGVEVNIRQESLGANGKPASWFFSGTADYRKAVEFVLDLENNALRVRFEKIEFTLPENEAERRAGQVRFFAVMNIPTLPQSGPAAAEVQK